ncbi:MAG: hypothetical protein R6W67_06555 [Bacteroidales bacterium]
MILTGFVLFMVTGRTSAQYPGVSISVGGQVQTFGASHILITDGGFRNNGTFTASDDNTVTFGGSSPQTIEGTAATTFNDLTINNTGGVVLAGENKSVRRKLLCNGPTNTNGILTLISTASGTALIDGSGTASVTGNVTMQRFLPSGFGYKYFSSPFQSSTVNEFSDEPVTALYMYDENRLVGGVPASGWVNYNEPSNPLIPLSGYAVNFGSETAEKTVDMTGTVNDGAISIPVWNNNQIYTGGFNLCGNPYPSPVDWNKINQLSTNIDDAVYYFKASSTDVYGGSYSTFINGISSDGLATNIIPSMQGFFVHVTNGSWPVSGTLAMNNSVRLTDLTHAFIKSATLGPEQLLRLSASFTDTPESEDPAVIYFDYEATSEFDTSLDALKLMNTDSGIPSLYSLSASGTKLSINSLPPVTVGTVKVPLGIKTDRGGTVVFRILDIDPALMQMSMYMTDSVMNRSYSLLPDMEYSVDLPAGDYKSRFFLSFSNSATALPEYIVAGAEPFTVHHSHGVLTAGINSLPGPEGLLSIYNISGQKLTEIKIYEPGEYLFRTDIPDGIYIITFSSAQARSSKKMAVIN